MKQPAEKPAPKEGGKKESTNKTTLPAGLTTGPKVMKGKKKAPEEEKKVGEDTPTADTKPIEKIG